jgi:hypothetical protein
MRSILIVAILFFSFGDSSGQKIKIPLTDSITYSVYQGSVEPLLVHKVWENESNTIDSVLWKTTIQPNVSLLYQFQTKEIDSITFARTVN